MERILQINDYPIEDGGGAEVILRQTMELLRARGLTVDAFTSADLVDARRSVLRYVHNSVACAALAEKLESFRPDVVHLHNYYHVLSPAILATLAAYKERRRVRVVMTAHDYHLICPNSGGSWFHYPSGRREVFDDQSITSARYLLSRSWDHRGLLYSTLKLLQHSWGYRWRKLHRVIDVVLCPSRFIEQKIASIGLPTRWLPHPLPQVQRRIGKPAGPLQMVFAGRLEPEKGLNEFLQQWPSESTAQLAVIGAGSELKKCKETCARLGIEGRVRFLGRLPHAEAVAEIARSHVLILPSRFLESYGLVLIEALMQGTNVLAANRGAIGEIVADAGVGHLYELDDAASMREQFRRIESEYVNGTLNRFDLAPFLAERNEARYVERLLNAYRDPSRVQAKAA